MSHDERPQWRALAPNELLSRKLKAIAWVLSAVVLLLVVCMQKIRIPLPEGWSTMGLPPFHASVNALVAVLLIISLAAIKLGRVRFHRATMMAAMGFSVVFLLSYVVYHMTNDPTLYKGVGTPRVVYFFLLITHILTAAVSLPFILFTFIAAWTHRIEPHRRLARWVYPLWLYVAVTGPVCYWMLRPYYG
jgi:putative membrane protein